MMGGHRRRRRAATPEAPTFQSPLYSATSRPNTSPLDDAYPSSDDRLAVVAVPMSHPQHAHLSQQHSTPQHHSIQRKRKKKPSRDNFVRIVIVATIALILFPIWILVTTPYAPLHGNGGGFFRNHRTRGHPYSPITEPFSLFSLNRANVPNFFAKETNQGQRLPILIIGGTDGSGTRAVVDALHNMGVVMLVDDPQTFDIHATPLFQGQGWPALVQRVLAETNGNVNYQWEDLSYTSQQIIASQMELLKDILSAKYHDTTKLRGWDTTQLPKNVAFAIKAPVAMLLLPVLSQFMGDLYFLHVLRDGRDIALSDNQSPVIKFYNATYRDSYEQRSNRFQGDLYPVRAMQLWNDWNTQVHTWATLQHNHTTRTIANDFQYMMVRTEDLVHSAGSDYGTQIKFQCLKALSAFVGAATDQDELLCCLSRLENPDFGKSAVHTEGRKGGVDRHKLGGGHRGHPRVTLSEEYYNSHMDGYFAPNEDGAAQQENGNPQGSHGDTLTTNRRLTAIPPNMTKDRSDDTWLTMNNDTKKDVQAYQRRRLTTSDKNDNAVVDAPKLVPRQFARQFDQWHDAVTNNAGTYQVETLQKSLEYGRRMERQWKKRESVYNVAFNGTRINLETIRSDCQILENHLASKGVVNLREIAGSTNKQELPPNKEMGSLTGEGSNPRGRVHERYGKWKRKLENRTELSQWLHSEGKEGLQIFGYEPPVEWDYKTEMVVARDAALSSSNSATFQCTQALQCDHVKRNELIVRFGFGF